jgi:hypothetical protein
MEQPESNAHHEGAAKAIDFKSKVTLAMTQCINAPARPMNVAAIKSDISVFIL